MEQCFMPDVVDTGRKQLGRVGPTYCMKIQCQCSVSLHLLNLLGLNCRYTSPNPPSCHDRPAMSVTTSALLDTGGSVWRFISSEVRLISPFFFSGTQTAEQTVRR